MSAHSDPEGPIVIQDAQVLMPSGEILTKDVAMSDGKITAVGTDLTIASNTRTIDAQGLLLLPGAIDSHACVEAVAFGQERSVLDESCAYVRGGITSLISAIHPLKSPAQSPKKPDKIAVPNKEGLATTELDISELSNRFSKSRINYGFSITAQQAERSFDLTDKACCISLRSVSEDSAQIESLFMSQNSLITFHVQESERQNLRLEMETLVARSRQYERRIHFQGISTIEAVELLYRDKPSWVTASVTPQQLMSGSLPLRSSLWQALLDGALDCIETHHTSRAIADSDQGLNRSELASSKAAQPHYGPHYGPIAEIALPLMLTQAQMGHCTVAQVANWMSTRIADIYGIARKGTIEPGYDADVVLVDLLTYRPILKEEIQTVAGWSPFEMEPLTGWPVVTIVGGQVAYEYGEMNAVASGHALQFDAN